MNTFPVCEDTESASLFVCRGVIDHDGRHHSRQSSSMSTTIPDMTPVRVHHGRFIHSAIDLGESSGHYDTSYTR